MPIALASIRNELLPGLFDVRGSYDMIPRQWDKVFTTHKSNMAVERQHANALHGPALSEGRGGGYPVRQQRWRAV